MSKSRNFDAGEYITRIVLDDLIESLTETVIKVEGEPQISLIDGQRCTHEWGINENGDARILCSVKTDEKCEACGEVFCPRHMHLHKRFYCVGILLAGVRP